MFIKNSDIINWTNILVRVSNEKNQELIYNAK